MNKKKSTQDPLPPTIIKNLNDKLYGKRKLGALEVEQIVKEYNKEDNKEKIIELITFLQENFVKIGSASAKKGGLIAIASVSIGLSNVSISRIYFYKDLHFCFLNHRMQQNILIIWFLLY